jgi:hypothetical protein
MTSSDELHRLWLAVEAIVGDSEIALEARGDDRATLAKHEPSEVELDAYAAAVAPDQLTSQRATVDSIIRDEWQRARAAKPVRTVAKREPVSPSLSRAELLAMVEQLRGAHPQQFAQHYRNLDAMSDETLRALVEDMLALLHDEEAP